MDVDMDMDMDVQARVVYEVVVAKACLICVAIRSPCGCAGGRATARCPVCANPYDYTGLVSRIESALDAGVACRY